MHLYSDLTLRIHGACKILAFAQFKYLANNFYSRLKDRRPNLDMNFDNDNVPGHDFCKPHSGCLRKGRKDICTAFVQNVAFCVDVMSCDHPFCSRIYHS